MTISSVQTAIFKLIDAQLKEALRIKSAPSLRIVVGFSGGLDSTVLLHTLSLYSKANTHVSIEACHINHQLSPNAKSWQSHCQTVCEELGVPFRSQVVTLEPKGLGIEAAAREARYTAFKDMCGVDGVLLLGQHLDDQAETVLIRLMRGSGPLGISAMQSIAFHGNLPVIRPLLDVPREKLEVVADELSLRWIEDESNASLTYDRNFLRHHILPALDTRWPALNQRLARSARLCREAVNLADEVAANDLAEVLHSEGGLRIEMLRQLSDLRLKNVIRYRLRRLNLPLPSEVVLRRVLCDVLDAGPDAKPRVCWKGAEARRYRGSLYFINALPAGELEKAEPVLLTSLSKTTLEGGVDALTLPWGGVLFIASSRQSLVSLWSDMEGRGAGTLAIELLPAPLQKLSVALGKGKSSVRPIGRSSNPLKYWWQQYHIPFWFRDKQPLLYSDGELIAAPGMFTCVNTIELKEGGSAQETEQLSRWVSWWPYSL